MSNKNLTPTQKKVKKPRPVYYDGPKKNMDPDVAADILTLYVTCKLGYSPIRCIIGHKNDHGVEDVVRQHMLGRKGVDGTIGELCCPNSKEIEEYYKSVIEHMVRKYGTASDPYVAKMMSKGIWHDQPAYAKKITECLKCNKHVEDDWKICPYCGHNLRIETSQKKLW